MSSLPSITGGRRLRGIALVVLFALGQAAAAGLAAFATRDVFAAFRDLSPDLPLLALGVVAASGLMIAALRYAERVVAEGVGQDFAAALRLTLFRHMARVSARDLQAMRSGALSLRFVGDLAAVRGWVSLGLSRMISALVVLPAATAALFLLNPNLGFAAAVPIGLGLITLTLLGPRLGPAHRRLRNRRASLAADMSERIPHAPELRLLGRIKIETDHLSARTEKLIEAALERARGAAILRTIPDAVSGIAAASLFLVALSTGAPGAEAAGALAAVGLMIQPMRDLAGVWDRHRAWCVARDKCARLLRLPKTTGVARTEKQKLADTPPKLSFRDVSAGALSGIDVVAAPGRKIAIVGPNGAGKSTLLSLAAGLEKPREGNVTIGDRKATTLTATERRRLIAFVGTRSPILSGSLRRALTMGIEEKPADEAILSQASVYGLDAVLERIGGLDGKVSEAGRNLSAGEIRRVLLTRAALSRPRLLLLDEPDDALDQDGARLVENLVFGTGATTLLITHDMDIAAMMDEIWVIEQGGLALRTTPDAAGTLARRFNSSRLQSPA
ncbi:ABC transporter ATP-binding protein [Thalassococcus sp. S3]|uniref:ATP-binding cassette domain-containing protein n=1 Tax=Thalassococcus sp. S3 TaxID=2017482 RepID=UPI0010244D3E|nr:ABC transporter ATP-binding protein [Thalassococcus sp. S3]QBF29773.1 hypothetical protein CFI11_00890 [Thalassococcus sp. S3]